MPSNTQKTSQHRRRKEATNGRKHKKARTRKGTPKFSVHPEGKPGKK